MASEPLEFFLLLTFTTRIDTQQKKNFHIFTENTLFKFQSFLFISYQASTEIRTFVRHFHVSFTQYYCIRQCFFALRWVAPVNVKIASLCTSFVNIQQPFHCSSSSVKKNPHFKYKVAKEPCWKKWIHKNENEMHIEHTYFTVIFFWNEHCYVLYVKQFTGMLNILWSGFCIIQLLWKTYSCKLKRCVYFT